MVLWITNFMLLLLGLAMLGYFGYMVSELVRGDCTDDIAPAPAPAPTAGPALAADAHSQSEYSQLDWTTDVPARRALLSDTFDQKDLWEFVAPFGVCGLAVVLTTCIGMCGIACSSRCLLNTYLCLLLLMTITQIVMVVLIIDKKSPSVPQNDRYERCEYHRIKHYYDKFHPEAVALAIVAAVLEVVSLVAVCCLRNMKRISADIETEDETHAYRQLPSQASHNTSRPPLNASRAGRDAWHQRMREKYGLDSTVFEPDAAPTASAPPPPKGNKCTIM